jgi:hypothetical protein
MRLFFALPIAFTLLSSTAATSALAADGLTLSADLAPSAAEAPPPSPSRGPFTQPLALGAYTVAWAGAYDAAGIGGRSRWEFWQERLGVELFAEALMVDWPAGASRHDIPIGFNLFAPLRLGSRVRARALAGMCAVFSFIEPSEPGAPPSNDVLFGVHGGLGLEVALAGPLVWFLDAQAVWYVGHDRTASDWTGSVSGALTQAVVFQPSSGLLVAFGR